MSKIIGNTTTTPMAIPDWNQTDETKADFIKNKPTILTETDVQEIIAEAGGSGGGEVNITVDDYLSTTSANPVQNKVVTSVINELENEVDQNYNAIQNHISEYESKVNDLIDHKQDTLTFDTTPTQDSENPVLSGGVYEAIEVAKTQMRVQTLLYTATSESEIEEIKIELIQTHGDDLHPGDHLIIREYYEGEDNINVFRDHVFILRQESRMVAKTWQLISKDDADATTKKYVDTKFSQIVVGENGVSIDGIVEPEPGTIPKRGSGGELRAFNADIGGPASDIEGYIPEDEVVTCKLLKQYAVPIPENAEESRGVVGYDGSGNVVMHAVTEVTVNGEIVEEFNADTKLDKVSTQTNISRVYAISGSGNQIVRNIADAPGFMKENAIAQYVSKGATIGYTAPDGVLMSGSPSKDYHVATKKYVDNQIEWIHGAQTYHATVIATISSTPSDNPIVYYTLGYSYNGVLPNSFFLPITTIQLIDSNGDSTYPPVSGYTLEFDVDTIDEENYYHNGPWYLRDANDTIIVGGEWEGAYIYEDQPHNAYFEEFSMNLNSDSVYPIAIIRLAQQAEMDGFSNHGEWLTEYLNNYNNNN